MLHLLLDYGCDNILLNTSGIKYSPAVAKGLAEDKLQLTISVDAGTIKTYEKIKLVKTYDIVCENLAKYAASQTMDKHRVCSKFIIVPGVNDAEEEIENWIENTHDLGICDVSIDIDLRWVQANFDKLKQYKRIYDLIVYTANIAERENLCLRYDERASIMRKIHKTQTAFLAELCEK